jgi:hypothetical protein
MKTNKDIAKLQTLAEAKLVLVLMRGANVNSASLQELSELTGLPLPEVAQGAHLLKVLNINVAKGFDTVTLAEEWKIVKATK